MINHINQNYQKITVIKKETIKNTETNENYKKGKWATYICTSRQHSKIVNVYEKKSHKKVKYLWEVSLEQKQNVCAALPSVAIQII